METTYPHIQLPVRDEVTSESPVQVTELNRLVQVTFTHQDIKISH